MNYYIFYIEKEKVSEYLQWMLSPNGDRSQAYNNSLNKYSESSYVIRFGFSLVQVQLWDITSIWNSIKWGIKGNDPQIQATVEEGKKKMKMK